MNTQTQPAVECRHDGMVRAHHPERAAFEAWCCTLSWGGDREALEIRNMAGSKRLGEYVNDHVEFAWCAWQAARPKRAAYGAALNVASALAQRKPLAAFAEMKDATHIGHRQFKRAANAADEATRLLAVKLTDALRAL